MVEINSNKPDRQEERRNEDRRTEHRHRAEKKMKEEPMRTFEAKMSEKAAQEKNSKSSVARHLHDLKKSKEEQQSLMEKILGVAKDKSQETEKSKVEDVLKRGKEESKKEKNEAGIEKDIKTKETKEADKKEGAEKTQEKDGEVSQEGHKRVAGKEDDQDGSGGHSSGQDSDSEQGSGERSLKQQTETKTKNNQLGDKQDATGFAAQLSEQGSSSSGGFQRGARSFTPENLDDIVTSIHHGFNEIGEEEFSVELNDDYFEGLKVQATRTENGVVLKFVCPNVSVRSTFIKYRPQVYKHLKSKDINVFRVDVV